MLWNGLDPYAQWALAGGLALRWLITGVSRAQERWTRSHTDRRQLRPPWRQPSTSTRSASRLPRMPSRRTSAMSRGRVIDD